MTGDVHLQLWLVILGGAFAAWAVLDRLLVPGVRWYFRKRTQKVIQEINTRFDLNLPAFKLTKRQIIIDRLIYDPQVLECAKKYSHEQGVSDEVAMEKVKRYTREIVPSFNAYLYFRIGNWLSRLFVRLLYRVRVGFMDEKALDRIDPESSVVFIMNHRSNMDYILLAYLALNKVALSFAVGEWARVWPIQQLARSMGAFFVRRGSGNVLYRCVLARYVQMATENGVVQAVFPEGHLSVDGKLSEPKIGLLDYMLRSFDQNKGRDLVFIPVGVNYDRVLEDRTQLLRFHPEDSRKSRLNIAKTTLRFILHNLWLMLRGGWHRFGYAVVNFGTPLSMREYGTIHQVDFSNMEKEKRIEWVKRLTQELMERVGSVIPVVPVSLLSSVFAEELDKTYSNLEIKASVQSLIHKLERTGAHVYIPRKDRDYAVEVGLRMLTLRHLVKEDNNFFHAAPEERKLLQYYANSIIHHRNVQ